MQFPWRRWLLLVAFVWAAVAGDGEHAISVAALAPACRLRVAAVAGGGEHAISVAALAPAPKELIFIEIPLAEFKLFLLRW